jgi:hypothetical protein
MKAILLFVLMAQGQAETGAMSFNSMAECEAKRSEFATFVAAVNKDNPVKIELFASACAPLASAGPAV